MQTCLKLFGSTLLLASALLGVSAQASSAVQLTEPAFLFDPTGLTLGFEFQVNRPVSVDSLGAFDSGGDGLAAGVTVGLWEDGVTPIALATAQIPSGSGAMLDGFFRYVNVQDVVLTPGHIYAIGAFFEGDQATSLGTGQGGLGSFDDRLSNITDRSGSSGFFELPISSDGTQGAWLGGNFHLQDVTSVPEPATGALLLSGLGVLAAGLARRRWYA
jgi:hypothetical protein